MSARHVFEEVVEPEWVSIEDGGMARIFQFSGDEPEDPGVFVKLQSWDESGKHVEWHELQGKRVRITVEVLD